MTLRKKAVLFLVSFLTGELILFAVMLCLLHQSDSLAEEAETSRALVFNSVQSVSSVLDATRAIGSYALTQSASSQKLFLQAMEQLTKATSSFQQVSERFPEDDKLAALTKSDTDGIAEILLAINAAVQEGASDKYTGHASRRINVLSKTVLPETLASFRQHANALIAKHKHELEKNKLRISAIKGFLHKVLFGGVLLNLVGCVVLVEAFSRNIASRLTIMHSNTERLLNDLPLHWPVAGNDEISDLDRIFHRMAFLLNTAAQRDKLILKSMPAGSISLSATLQIEYVNPQFEKMTGFCQTELEGELFRSIFASKETMDTTASPDSDAIKTLVGKVVERPIARKSGEPFMAEVSLSRYTDDQKESFVCNILDVTDRHEIERLKRELVNIVSHDLRTPVTAIQAVLRLLETGIYGELTGRGKRAVEQSIHECSRLVKLITDLLTMSKIESGRLVLDIEPCSIAALLERSIAAIRASADENGLTVSLHGDLDEVLDVDESRLVQVFVNLLSNAVKYTAPGGVIDVNSQILDGCTRITVADNGCGIPEHAQAAIFERFTQARASDALKGSGLGLAICKLIVEAHNGRIGVNSGQGEGSRFWVELPHQRRHGED